MQDRSFHHPPPSQGGWALRGGFSPTPLAGMIVEPSVWYRLGCRLPSALPVRGSLTIHPVLQDGLRRQGPRFSPIAQPCRDARGGKRRDIVALKLSVSSIRGGETVSLPFYSVTDLAAGPIISVGLSRFRREIGAHHLPLIGVRRMLSEDARPRTRSFLLIAQSARIVTGCPVPAALRVFQHLAGFHYHQWS